MIPAALGLPLARLVRTPRAWPPLALWIAVAVGAAFVERARAGPHGADHALLETFGAVALPLLAYAFVGAVVGSDGLGQASRALVAFGALPRDVALGGIAVATVSTALTSAALGAVVTLVAHGAGDPPLAHDVITSAWIAAVGGVAYAALFALGSTLGRRGGGRSVVLVLDWLLGSGSGVAALLTPRAHVRSLLGGDAPIALSAAASALTLVALAALFTALAVRRTSLR